MPRLPVATSTNQYPSREVHMTIKPCKRERCLRLVLKTGYEYCSSECCRQVPLEIPLEPAMPLALLRPWTREGMRAT